MIATRTGNLETYHFANLAKASRLVHFVSTRHGGVSQPPYQTLNLGLHVGDSLEDVLTNRRRLLEHLALPPDWLTLGQQVHGDKVMIVDKTLRGAGAFSHETAIPNRDALITAEPDICLGVLVADCVPVLLYDRRQHVAAVVHAGWRGTILGIAAKTVWQMLEGFECRAEDLLAGIGPSIGPMDYEVGPEVIEHARASYPKIEVIRKSDNGKGYFDLSTATVYQLRVAGIPLDNIEVAGISTYSHADTFFSHRRGQPTGRFMAGITLRS